MTEHTALSKAEDWIQQQPYFNPNAPDLINKVAEATGIIRVLVAINADLLEALKAIRSSIVCNGDMSISYAIDGTIERMMIETIRKAT